MSANYNLLKVKFTNQTGLDANTNVDAYISWLNLQSFGDIEYNQLKITFKNQTGLSADVHKSTYINWLKIALQSDLTLLLENKVDKETGKGLSTNDFTDDLKEAVEVIDVTGDGSKYLSDDGTYSEVSGGGGVNIKRSETVGLITYMAYAPEGSAESAAVWAITKIVTTATGDVTSAVQTLNYKWTERNLL